MIRFIQDYVTKSLPPESFARGQEVERSNESELYFVRLGVAGYLLDGVLVDQDFRPIVLPTDVVEIVATDDRRFGDGGRGGERIGLDAPQRASTGPGNAALFGTSDVDPTLHQVEIDQLTADLAASVAQFDDHRTASAAEIGRLTAALDTANAAKDAAEAKLGAAEDALPAMTSERDGLKARVTELEQMVAALPQAGASASEAGSRKPGGKQ